MGVLLLDLLYTLLYIPYAYIEAAFRIIVPRRPKSLQGQIALVTGAGKGIGRETALQLAAKGATVILWDVDEESNLSTVEELHADGKAAYSYTCDVSNSDEVTKMAAKVRRDVGEVDILVNNAGIVRGKRLLKLTENEVRRTLEVNVLAVYLTIREFLPMMMKQNKGHIVNVASVAGLFGFDYLTDYGASKYAVRGMTDCLEKELRAEGLHGIKVTTVYPAITNTKLVRDLPVKPVVKFGKVLEASEVAAAIVDGIQRNRREVFVPGYASNIPYLSGVLPWKAFHVIMDFLDVRFAGPEDRN